VLIVRGEAGIGKHLRLKKQVVTCSQRHVPVGHPTTSTWNVVGESRRWARGSGSKIRLALSGHRLRAYDEARR
jgi:hypothetical protein